MVSSFQVHTTTAWTHTSPRAETASIVHRMNDLSSVGSARSGNNEGTAQTCAISRAAKTIASRTRSGSTTRRKCVMRSTVAS